MKPISALLVLLVSIIIGCASWNLCTPDRPKPFYIYDEDERIVIYHGINIANTAKTDFENLPWQKREDFDRLKDWGFNLVRYLIFWQAVEPSEGNYNNDYLYKTVLRIQCMQELGIDVVLDFHQDLYGPDFCGGNGFPSWTTDSDDLPFTCRQPWNMNYLEPAIQASYRNFWNNDDQQRKYVRMIDYTLKALLPYCKNIIGFDVMNEPFPVLPVGLKYPKDIKFPFSELLLLPELKNDLIKFERVTLPNLYNQVLDMMNRKSYNCKMFFEPVIYTSAGVPTFLQFKADARCVYFPHYYDPICHEGKPYKSENKKLMEAAVLIKAKEGIGFGTPMLIGEWGIGLNVEGYLDYITDFTSLLNSYGAGWTYYTYDKGHPFGVLDTGGYETKHLQRLVCVYAQRINGRDPKYKCSAEKFTLTYTPLPHAVPTVIFIPDKLREVKILINGKAYTRAKYFTYMNDNNKEQKITISWKN